jgi:hypothetical protein
MSAVTDPIRKLLKEEKEFAWTHEQNAAFEKINYAFSYYFQFVS